MLYVNISSEFLIDKENNYKTINNNMLLIISTFYLNNQINIDKHYNICLNFLYVVYTAFYL